MARLSRVVVPGLIGAHVHLEWYPHLRMPATQHAVSEEDRVRALAKGAEALIAAGIMTVRDSGGGAHLEH